MSATAASLSCPICAHTGVFASAQSLRDRLIHVSTNKILCPVCQEEVSGLDKLTIHLFSHVKKLSIKNCEDQQKTNIAKSTYKPVTENQASVTTQPKKSKTAVTKNKTPSSTAAAPVKYVKIYPKLPVISLNTVPVIDMSQGSVDDSVKSLKTTLIQTNTTCNVCGLQFVDTDILRMHKCLIHNIDDESANQNFTRYQCHLCPKNFKMRGSLMVHLRVAHFGFLSGNCSTTGTDKEDQGDKAQNRNADDKILVFERNDNKQWQCDVCHKCFTTKYFLKKHKRLHTGETPYACTQCNKTFTFQQSYHKHLLYHNDEKPHSCNYCGRAFKELSTLHNHQRIHTGEKPFSCETCGKCFRQRVSYLVHRRIHTGVMPYKCTACDKSFRYKVSQRTHKCLSKPPGTVIRQSGDLVEKLKKKHDISQGTSLETDQQPLMELVLTGAKLSLEDMEAENFSLISDTCESSSSVNDNKAYSNVTPSLNSDKPAASTENVDADDMHLEALIDSIPVIDKNIPSPSEILKNLCLSKDDEYINIIQEQESSKNFDLYKDFDVFM